MAMAEIFSDGVVPEASTLRDALGAVDRGASGIALAVDDEGRLVGVATDGDLRRALLRGDGLDDPLAPVINRRFIALGSGQTRADALDLMAAHQIDAIPVVDDDGRPVALHLLHAFLQPEARDNRAVIMAGGRGIRLRPLTDDRPKPMLRVAGRPILERIVLHLVGYGIRRISISVHYLGDVIEDHFGDGSFFGATIDYLRETEPLGTAGALGLLPDVPTSPVLVLNGDLVTSVDIEAMLAFHATGGFAATIGTRHYVHTVPFGCVERQGDRVVAIEEKPAISRDVSTGIYALEPWVIGLVAPGRPLMMPDLIRTVLARDPAVVGAFEIDDDWVDVGQREQLARAREGA
jgi:dTDP-glucose pyrophosphorylase